ncbi:hypothetical protein FN846DRAFT_941702 [Sphaerosporella brunnea]|uniref:F-box domain-containing protein n=1 Tax=Sphaerosporella brunnea TaxID=1250544 RepID=A0A5J5F1M6_9PEZI|nr:hypothetical protein FN846DRAFT_941702 [Sphaerosporella brunnea]
MPARKETGLLLLPRELLDDLLGYLSAKDLRNLLVASPLFIPLVSQHLRRLLSKLNREAADNLLCYLISRGRLSHASFVLRHLRANNPVTDLPKACPGSNRYRKALHNYVSALPIKDQQLLNFQLRSQPRNNRLATSLVATKSLRPECLTELLKYPLRFTFCVALRAAAELELREQSVTSAYPTNWRREVAVDWFVSGYHTATVGMGEKEDPNEAARDDGLVGKVLAAPSIPASVKRVLICHGAGLRHSVLHLLDSRNPGDKDAARVLRKVLGALREDDGTFPEFAVRCIATGFVRALRRACQCIRFGLELLIVGVWLEECADLLFARLATRKPESKPDSRKDQWKPLVQGRHPNRIWELFFVEGPWADGDVTAGMWKDW